MEILLLSCYCRCRLATVSQVTTKSSKSKSKLLCDWRFTANHFGLASSPLRLTITDFSFQLSSCSNSLYVTSSLTRRWVGLLWTYPTFSSSVRIAHVACYCKYFLLHHTQVLCQYRLCRVDHSYITCLMLQRQLSHMNGLKLNHRQV
jgi:hypothetical protein